MEHQITEKLTFVIEMIKNLIKNSVSISFIYHYINSYVVLLIGYSISVVSFVSVFIKKHWLTNLFTFIFSLVFWSIAIGINISKVLVWLVSDRDVIKMTNCSDMVLVSFLYYCVVFWHVLVEICKHRLLTLVV